MLKCFFEILKELEKELKVKTVVLSFVLLNQNVLQAKIDIYKEVEIISFSRRFPLAEIEMLSTMTEQAVFYNWKHEILEYFGE